jgi:hypothetical protein
MAMRPLLVASVLAILCATAVVAGDARPAAGATDAFRLAKFTNCIRLTDGLYSGAPAAYTMLYAGGPDLRIAFAVIVTANGHRPDRIGAIFAARRAAWVDRFRGVTIRGVGPGVPAGDTSATASDKAALAKHVRLVERQCVAAAQH